MSNTTLCCFCQRCVFGWKRIISRFLQNFQKHGKLLVTICGSSEILKNFHYSKTVGFDSMLYEYAVVQSLW
jgi:hypothetical protein